MAPRSSRYERVSDSLTDAVKQEGRREIRLRGSALTALPPFPSFRSTRRRRPGQAQYALPGVDLPVLLPAILGAILLSGYRLKWYLYRPSA